MFSDGVVDLVKKGVINGARKPLHPGKMVACFLMGTRKLYDFVHDNPEVEMHPVDYTNDTAIIRRHPNMVAINSAIQVDLTGQVCADSIGTQLYSGVGGQLDFMRGAALAEGGKAIIALPSTAREAARSLASRPCSTPARRHHHAGAPALRGDRVRRGVPAREIDPAARHGSSSPSRTRASGGAHRLGAQGVLDLRSAASCSTLQRRSVFGMDR